MRFYFLLTFICTVGCQVKGTSGNCGTSKFSQGRIVGGGTTRPGAHPFMVSLEEDAGSGFIHVCGGSVLNENWILTAAHCIEVLNQPSKYQALVGLYRLSQRRAKTVQLMKISKIVIHEEYDDDNLINDIALLKTAKPINIAGSKGYVNTICLPEAANKDPEGYATVTGWGHTYEDGENSDILKAVSVPIIERDLCNAAYDDDIHDDLDEVLATMICAGMRNRDSCQNDSGGPLFQTDKKGVSTVIGIVSHGGGCGEKYFPGIYTNVAEYTDWIQNVISK